MFHSGWGFFPRQKLLSVQVAFLNIDSLWFSFKSANRGWRAPACRTISRHLGESPAMFPRAHTLSSAKSLNWRKYLRLLTDVEDLGREESDKVGDGTCLDNYLSVVACTGCNVYLSVPVIEY
jgi:hypothetical protein